MNRDDKLEWLNTIKSNDTQFDGRVFVGVSSTGIYCRPVCKARMPKLENCTFYETAAAAEQTGYRPCLMCRPELAPGRPLADATKSLAHRAARYLEENCGSELDFDILARMLGCTDRHLRRVFAAEFNVSPIQYLQTCRLLFAKNLLTDTDLSVVDVAMTAGFGSLRRFNDLFKKHYKLSPTGLRKKAAWQSEQQDEITLLLSYRPPYRWNEMMDFLALRAIPGVEAVRNNKYLRTVRHMNSAGEHIYGWIRVSNLPGKNALKVAISSSLLSALPQVLSRIRHLFDLHCEPTAVAEILSLMNDIKPGLFTPGLRVPGCYDPFEMSVRAVLGQQITVKAAGTLAARLTKTYGDPIPTDLEGLTHCFPTPEKIVSLKGPISDHLGPLGIIASRAKTIYELAHVFAEKTIDFDLCAQPEAEIDKLMSLPGIGKWTADYIAMRTMGWPDAFLNTDHGVKKALETYTPKEILTLSENWRPWRSYATVNLWNSLS